MPQRMPRDVAHEIACKCRYPHRIETAAGLIRFRRSRWEHWNAGEEAATLRHREAVFWLHDGRERIGLLKLSEYDLEPCLYWQEFWRWADGLEQQAGNIVEAMREAWGGYFVSVADYGPILFATTAWIAPAWRTRVDMSAAFDACIAALAPSHSAIFLVAYPQDDENDDRADEDVEELGNWDWRQRALIRLYERKLGFRLLVTKDGRPDIMWRPHPEKAEYIETLHINARGDN